MPAFPSIDLSHFDLSKIDLPKIDLPKVDLPSIDTSTIDTDRVKDLARDAAYVGIGLGVLAVQQAQVRRREISGTVERQVRQLVDTLR